MTIWTDEDHPENMTPEEIAEREAADKLSFYKLLARVFSEDPKKTQEETPTEPMEKRVRQIADMIGREAYYTGSARGDWSPAATVWYNIANDLEAAADFIAEANRAKTDPQALAKFLQAPAPVCKLEARPPEDPPDWQTGRPEEKEEPRPSYVERDEGYTDELPF